jgi:phage I-like protein
MAAPAAGRRGAHPGQARPVPREGRPGADGRQPADGGKLVLDENHSTDLAAPKGGEAPARGWIVELQARATASGAGSSGRRPAARRSPTSEYRGISPVIAHLKDKTIVAIRRASLVNQPNLEGLTALHSEETDMDFRNEILEALGLAA